MRYKQPAWRKRNGTYTLEFALCIPILVASLFACFEFSRFVFVRHSIDQAAYRGARAAITINGTADDAKAAVQQSLRGTGLDIAAFEIDPAVISKETRIVTVKVQLKFDEVWINPIFLSPDNLVGECTLDHENASLVVDD